MIELLDWMANHPGFTFWTVLALLIAISMICDAFASRGGR